MLTDMILHKLYHSHKPYESHSAHVTLVTLLLFLAFAMPQANAQISIAGNVYGGGNEGDTEGSTTVTIRTGQIKNVFGGARMADVGGRAFTKLALAFCRLKNNLYFCKAK